MPWTAALFTWLNSLPLLPLGGFLIVSVILAGGAGHALRVFQERGAATASQPAKREAAEGFLVSGLLGLLALLLGFTFSLAIDRYEVRRHLVMAHSNTIGTAYLRVQLLPEPHRARLSGLLVDYTRNMLLLARAQPEAVPPLISTDDRLLRDIWTSTVAAHDAIQTRPFSISFLDSINAMIDKDASRRGERSARLPSRVFAALFLYLVVTGAVFGYVLSCRRTRLIASFLMGLLVVSLLLIIDIDQPITGHIVESQQPMEAVLDSLIHHPPGSYGR
jgi:hypothetical protein